MDALLGLLDTYGMLLLFAVGFAEYAGVPIASVPVLIAAGSVARIGGLPMPPIILGAAAGGLAADALWFWLARRKGQGLVNVACRLSPNPRVCIGGVAARVERVGAPYVLTAKFLPGAGNLIAAAAGLGGMRPGTFLGLDAVALMAWGFAYAGLGWVFSDQVESIIMVAGAYSRWLIVLAVGLVGVGATYRYLKSRHHAAVHATG